jgi:arylsulfatase A-like enzyme
LSHRKFDEIKDCRNLHCDQKFAQKNDGWDPLDGINDECAADALVSWIKEEPGKPFFGMMWTYQTHYPYYAGGTEKNYDVTDPTLNRYLNAVNHSDMVLGKLLDQLKANGLYESTLVVVIGDHGEAFGRHDQTTHASNIYEENLHIPCVFINPAFKGERKDALGGMIDIAPTIMNVLGSTPADKWQGRSLLSTKRNERVYFFCPWSDHLFGYREGTKKYIYNATKNRTEVYDLKTDSTEANNISSFEDLTVPHYKLASWVQYQEGFMKELLVKQAGK